MAIEFRNGLSIGPNALYPFASFTFTTARASGSLGPSGSAILSAYTGSSSGSYFSNPLFFTTGSFQGYQIWTVPQTATYEIETAGARGGTAPAYSSSLSWGNGAVIKARVPLTQGQKLMMVVGQVSDAYGVNVNQYTAYQGFGGGGGSFVTISGSLPTPLVVAGGGGGSGRYSGFNGNTLQMGRSGSTSTSGTTSALGATGGSGSLGGRSHISTGSVVSANQYDGGAGGGFLGNGENGNATLTRPFSGGTFGEGGNAFVSGSKGGNASTSWGAPPTYPASWGGFGGGGSGNGIISAGGGGGYSGGGGGYTATSPGADGGGGGGSFVVSSAVSVATSNGLYDGSSSFSGSAITNLNTYNSGSGYIKITKL